MKKTLLTGFSLLLLGISVQAAHPEAEKSAQKIDQSLALDKKTARVYASWWGFDENDSVAAIQQAIDSGAGTVIIPALGKTWLVSKPVILRSNLTLILEPGVVIEAKEGAFRGRGDSILKADDMENIIIRGGKNSQLRMRKDDYTRPPYEKSEARMGIWLKGCENVLIEDIRVDRSGGDGFYLGYSDSRRMCRNITLRRVEAYDNFRQGISITGADGVLVEDSIFSTTAGTAPESGIDIEPDHEWNDIRNIVFRNVTADSNAGGGFMVALWPLTAKSKPWSITFENCIARGNFRYGAFLISYPSGPYPAGSFVKIINCQTLDNCGPELIFENIGNGGGVQVQGGLFESMTEYGPQVVFDGEPSRLGGVEFLNPTIRGRNDPVVAARRRFQSGASPEIKGAFHGRDGERVSMRDYQ